MVEKLLKGDAMILYGRRYSTDSFVATSFLVGRTITQLTQNLDSFMTLAEAA